MISAREPPRRCASEIIPPPLLHSCPRPLVCAHQWPFVEHRGRAGPVADAFVRTAYVDEQLSMAAPRGLGFADEAEKASDNIVSGITGVYSYLALPALLQSGACAR